MKRRKFGLLAGVSLGALATGSRKALASSADAAQLSSTLTPFGAERAGNAAGTIPAWTGGMTTNPPGIEWNPATDMAPDFWADEQPLYIVDASNMAQYQPQLTEGVQFLIQNRGMSLKVYPTHRTAAAPQWVYDNIAANVGRAQLDPAGGRFGFIGGYGGAPFPIPDTSDPYAAGAQIMWNHATRWAGSAWTYNFAVWVMQGGQLVQTSGGTDKYNWPYYDPNGSLETYKGYQIESWTYISAPATSVGGEVIERQATDPYSTPNLTWELLNGQGRVRKMPEFAYDVPSGYTGGIANVDEYYGFAGALDRYDWKYVGKIELLIPYNNNKLRRTPAAIAHGPHFLNPDVMRWELHRVWVVEATLHPGERNTLARRRLYVDEDNWTVAISDGWDGHNNLYKCNMTTNVVFPNLPGTVLLNSHSHNLQTGDYCSILGPWGDPPSNQAWVFAPVPGNLFDPQVMASSAAY
jgi:hypothetical protein